MATIGNLKAILTLDASQFRRGLSKAQAKLASAGRKMQSMGRSMTAKLSAPLAAVGGVSAKMAADMEEGLGRIQGLVGLSRKQVQKFRDDFVRLSEQTGQSAQDLKRAMFFITSNLFRGKKAVELLEASAKGATAGLGNMRKVARTSAAAINNFGEDALTAREATSTLLATFKKGSIQSLPGLTRGFSRVAPLAAEAGLSMQETAAAIAAMTLQGTKASTAGRQLRQVISKLIDPSKQSEKAFKKAGISLEKVQKTLTEGDLLGALKILKDETKGNMQQLTDLIPRMRAFTGVLQIVGSSVEKNTKIFKALRKETGQSLKRAFDIMAKTAKVKFFKALQKIKNPLRKLGFEVLPRLVSMFKTVANFIDSVVQSFLDLSKPVRDFLIKFSGIAIIAGPALIVLGSLVTTLAAMLSIFTALSPILFTIATALGTVTAAFGLFELTTKKAVLKVVKFIKNVAVPSIINAFQFLKITVVEFFLGLADGLKKSGVLDTIKKFASQALKLFGNMADFLVGEGNLKLRIVALANAFGENLGKIAGVVLKKLINGLARLISWAGQVVVFIKTNWPVIKSTVVTVWNTIKSVAIAVFKNLITIVSGVISTLIDAWSFLASVFTGKWSKAGDALISITEGIALVMRDIFLNTLTGVFGKITNKAKKSLRDFILNAQAVTTLGLSEIVPGIKSGGKKALNTVLGIKEGKSGIPKGGLVSKQAERRFAAAKKGLKGAFTTKENRGVKALKDFNKKLGKLAKEATKEEKSGVQIDEINMEGRPDAVTKADLKRMKKRIENNLTTILKDKARRGDKDLEEAVNKAKKDETANETKTAERGRILAETEDKTIARGGEKTKESFIRASLAD